MKNFIKEVLMAVKKEVIEDKPKTFRSVRKDKVSDYEKLGWKVVKEGKKRFRELQADLVLMEK